MKSGQDDMILTCLRVLQKIMTLPIRGKDGSITKHSSLIIIINVLYQVSGCMSFNAEYYETNDLFNAFLRAVGVMLEKSKVTTF